MKIRHVHWDGTPRPEPDPDSYDEGSGTLATNPGPGLLERRYYNKETGEWLFTRTLLFDTIEEAEASIRTQKLEWPEYGVQREDVELDDGRTRGMISKPRERKHVQFYSPYEDPEDGS